MGLAAGLLLAGAGLQAYGQYQAGEEASAVADYNAQVKEREAQAAEQRSMIQSRKQAQAAARKMSELRAGFGTAGAVSTSGAPLQIIGEQAKQSEMENLEIGYEGTTEAKKLRSEGAMIKREGKSARRAGRIGAGATLLTGFGTAYA
jgi:hypothetical protein